MSAKAIPGSRPQDMKPEASSLSGPHSSFAGCVLSAKVSTLCLERGAKESGAKSTKSV